MEPRAIHIHEGAIDLTWAIRLYWSRLEPARYSELPQNPTGILWQGHRRSSGLQERQKQVKQRSLNFDRNDYFGLLIEEFIIRKCIDDV